MHPQRHPIHAHKMKPRICRRPHIHRRHPLGILRGATRAHYLGPRRPKIHFAPFRARGSASIASLITRLRGTVGRRRFSRASTRNAPGVARKVSGGIVFVIGDAVCNTALRLLASGNFRTHRERRAKPSP